jgi:hypothetical protein
MKIFLLPIFLAGLLAMLPASIARTGVTDDSTQGPAPELVSRTSETLRYDCDSIFVGEYLRYDRDSEITLSHPPKAYFRPIAILKGPPAATAVPVTYAFDDKGTAPKSTAWKFDASMMPETRSKWIIFIQRAIPKDGRFETFQNSKGRLEFTLENFSTVMSGIERQDHENHVKTEGQKNWSDLYKSIENQHYMSRELSWPTGFR